ncbi:hypothetical protein C3L33_16292, partial [Rhododendron williamsianum]
MASRSSDHHQPALSSLGKAPAHNKIRLKNDDFVVICGVNWGGKTSGEINGKRQPLLINGGGKTSGEINGERQPLLLINGEQHFESFSVLAVVLPFLFPALGGFLYGYDIGSTSCATISVEVCCNSGLSSSLQSATLSGITWYNLSSMEIGLITSGSLYGALIGSILAFNVADFLGRRRELMVAAILYLVGAVVTALAPYFVIMVVGRFVFGIGIGLVISLVACNACCSNVYFRDSSKSDTRPTNFSERVFYSPWDGCKYCLLTAGYTFGSLLVDTVSGWRYMYGASTPVAVIMGIGMWWLPSSPRWLLLCAIQGKGSVQDLRETAISCLCRLQGKAVGNSSSEQVDEILAELSYMGDEKEAKIADMFHGKCLKALTISAGLVLFQQITGQPSVLYYAASILQSAGFSAASDATRVSILLGLLKLIMTGVAVLVIDRLGRRPLLLGGVSAMVISLFLLGSYYTFLDDAPVMAVVSLLLYVGCYQLSFGPIGWLMISEIFPLRMRGRGLSIAVLVNFGANAIVTFAFSPLKELLGAGILFFIFGGIAVASLFFIYFIVPETKGLSLEEIEAKLL